MARRTKEPRNIDLEEAVRTLVSDGPKSFEEIREATGAEPAAVESAIRELAAQAGYKASETPAFIRIDPDSPVTVTTYDSKGEAIDVEAVRHPELPGMPEPIEIWPRYLKKRVSRIKLKMSYSGAVDGDLGKLLIKPGERLRLVVDLLVDSHAHDLDGKATDGALIGTARCKVLSIEPYYRERAVAAQEPAPSEEQIATEESILVAALAAATEDEKNAYAFGDGTLT